MDWLWSDIFERAVFARFLFLIDEKTSVYTKQLAQLEKAYTDVNSWVSGAVAYKQILFQFSSVNGEKNPSCKIRSSLNLIIWDCHDYLLDVLK
jgi:hypothetical protein